MQAAGTLQDDEDENPEGDQSQSIVTDGQKRVKDLRKKNFSLQ